MSFGITFGSVGDLIAVGQLAFTLARALNDRHGSAKAYQALIKELKNFDNSLLQARVSYVSLPGLLVLTNSP
jgi:hypothetical protein